MGAIVRASCRRGKVRQASQICLNRDVASFAANFGPCAVPEPYPFRANIGRTCSAAPHCAAPHRTAPHRTALRRTAPHFTTLPRSPPTHPF